MAEYHVSCGNFFIYAGILNQKGDTWKSKTECTDEAINAVRDYMVEHVLGGLDCSISNEGGFEWLLKDGRSVQLRIKIENPNDV